MDIKNIINEQKNSIVTGEWKTGTIPRSKWPSRRAKAKAYKFGPSYSWRIIEFGCGEYECRVRILLNESKQIFKALLGVTKDNETKMICEYEFHASEPGWHCHTRCGPIEEISGTRTRYGGIRLPKAGAFHRRSEFMFKSKTIDKVSAFNCAVEFFKIKAQGELL